MTAYSVYYIILFVLLLALIGVFVYKIAHDKKIARYLRHKECLEELGQIQFRCRACGQKRFHQDIDVHKRQGKGDLAYMGENFNYCNDNPECLEKVKRMKSFVDEES